MTTALRDDYTDKMKKQLDELNAQIDALEAKATTAQQKAHDSYMAEVAKLRKQSQLAMTQFSELKTAGEDRWDRMTAEMDKVRDAFTHSFRYFKSQI